MSSGNKCWGIWNNSTVYLSTGNIKELCEKKEKKIYLNISLEAKNKIRVINMLITGPQYVSWLKMGHCLNVKCNISKLNRYSNENL